METYNMLQSQPGDLDAQPREPGPVGRGKDRRASLVIQETKELLNGLHKDADRSNALMAELEQLLAAAQQASRATAPRSPDRTDTTGAQTTTSLHFASIEPLVDTASSSGDEAGITSDDEDVPNIGESAPLIARPSALAKKPLVKRRSSVVTFDGGSLLTAAPSSGPLAVTGSGNSMTGGSPARTLHAPSFSRGRASFSQQGGRSWVESNRNSLRRPTQTDVGDGGVMPSGASFSNPMMISSIAISGMSFTGSGTGGRRSSTTDAQDPLSVAPSLPSQSRRASSLAYGSSGAYLSVSQLSPSVTALRNASGDGDVEAELGSCESVQSYGSGSNNAASVGAQGRHGGGRFMRIIQGIFQTHNEHRQSGSLSGSGLLPTAASLPSSGSFKRASVELLQAPLESARAQGALSGMTLAPLSQSQPQPQPQLQYQQPAYPYPSSPPGTSGGPSSSQPGPLAPQPPPPQLRGTSRSSLSSMGMRSMLLAAGANTQLSVAVPPPGDAPQRASPRAALAHGPGSPAAAAGAPRPKIVRRSTSMSAAGYNGLMTSPTPSAAAAAVAAVAAAAAVGGSTGSAHANAAVYSGASSPLVASPTGGYASAGCAPYQSGSALLSQLSAETRTGLTSQGSRRSQSVALPYIS